MSVLHGKREHASDDWERWWQLQPAHTCDKGTVVASLQVFAPNEEQALTTGAVHFGVMVKTGQRMGLVDCECEFPLGGEGIIGRDWGE